MKNKLIWIIVIAVVLVIAILAIVFYPQLKTLFSKQPNGEQAKDFTVYDADGNQVKLSSFFGKPIVVNFWGTWCPPCKAELPAFQELQNKYDGQVEFLMVNTCWNDDNAQIAKSFVQVNGYTFAIYLDSYSSAQNAYNVTSIPLTLFINADGVLVNSHLGVMSEVTLESYISQIK